jgi:hypothetical protein
MSLGVEVARTERCTWKTKALLLGNRIRTANAALFAIGMVVKNLISILVRVDHFFAKIVTGSGPGLAAAEGSGQLILSVIAGMKGEAQSIEDTGGQVQRPSRT